MARSPIYEQTLNNASVSWEYLESVNLDLVSRRKSLENQARLHDPLDDELVDGYAARKREGDQFPAPVAYFERGRYVVIDGNNRIAADDKNGTKETDLYWVKTDDPLVQFQLTCTFNNLVNGKRLSREEAIHHAVEYVRRLGQSIVAASKVFGIGKDEINRALRGAEGRDVMAAHGIKDTGILSDACLYAMSSMRDAGEDVHVAAIRVAAEAGLTSRMCEELARIVRSAKSHNAKMASIEQFAGSEEVANHKAKTRGGRVRPSLSPEAQLAAPLRATMRVLDLFPDDRSFRGNKFKETREIARAVYDRLASTYGLGSRSIQDKEAS